MAVGEPPVGGKKSQDIIGQEGSVFGWSLSYLVGILTGEMNLLQPQCQLKRLLSVTLRIDRLLGGWKKIQLRAVGKTLRQSSPWHLMPGMDGETLRGEE